MTAEKVREYYRRQGEERMRSALSAKLDALATKWEGIGLFNSADTLRTAVAEIASLVPAVEIDEIQSVAYNAGKGMGTVLEQDRIIAITEKHGKVCNFEAVHEHPCDVCAYLKHLAGQIKDPTFKLGDHKEPEPCPCHVCELDTGEPCNLCAEACLPCQDQFDEEA
jgi:hypothetical protein